MAVNLQHRSKTVVANMDHAALSYFHFLALFIMLASLG